MSTQKRFSEVREIPRSEIIVSPDSFQGRQSEYSEDTVKQIVSNGFYDKSMEPIVVWPDPVSGKYVVLSGHSRWEASRRLYKSGQKDLETMAAKVFQGDKDDATDYAVLESNRGSTEEGLLSDLAAYRRAIQTGKNKQYLAGIFKPESRLRKLQNLAELNPKGQFIEQLSSPGSVSFPYLERNAQWIGELRAHYPRLTDAHENEIFKWIYLEGKGLKLKKDQLFSTIEKRVSRIDFDPELALNLNNAPSSSALTDPLQDEIKAINQEIEALHKKMQVATENIARARKENPDRISFFQKLAADLQQLIIRKIEERDKLRSAMGKIEREVVADLFSQPEPGPSPEPATLPKEKKGMSEKEIYEKLLTAFKKDEALLQHMSDIIDEFEIIDPTAENIAQSVAEKYYNGREKIYPDMRESIEAILKGKNRFLKTKEGFFPNHHGVYLSKDVQTFILPDKRKKAVPDGKVQYVELENSKWISAAHTESYGEPLMSWEQFDSRQEAINAAAQTVIKRSKDKRVIDWANSLIDQKEKQPIIDLNVKITKENYAEKAKSIDFVKSPDWMQEGNQYMQEFADLYGEDNDIDSAIDDFLDRLNAYLAKQNMSSPSKKKKPVKVNNGPPDYLKLDRLKENLVDVAIDLDEGEDDTALAGLLSELDDAKDDYEKVQIHLDEFKESWLPHFFDTKAASEIKTIIDEYEAGFASKPQIEKFRKDLDKIMMHRFAIDSSDYDDIRIQQAIDQKETPNDFALWVEEKYGLDRTDESMYTPSSGSPAKAKGFPKVKDYAPWEKEVMNALLSFGIKEADVERIIEKNPEALTEMYATLTPYKAALKLEKKYHKDRKDKEAKLEKVCPPVDGKGERRIDDKAIQILDDCIAAQPQTKELHFHGGKYDESRQELHEKILEEFRENKPCVRKEPIAILTGGPPGSGKSTFLKHYAPWINGKTVYHIDADEVRAQLPEYKGWNASSTHLETKDIVNQLIERIGTPCQYDLVYDGTMNKATSYIPLIEKLRSLGYKIFVIYIEVPKKISVDRAMSRYKKSGRYVPVSVIDEVFDNGLAAYEKIIKMADGYIRVDNGGSEPEIVEEGGEPIPKSRKYAFEKSSTEDIDEGLLIDLDFDISDITFNIPLDDIRNYGRPTRTKNKKVA